MLEKNWHRNERTATTMTKHAVVVMKDSDIVGHVPRFISRVLWVFLARGGRINCLVTGSESVEMA